QMGPELQGDFKIGVDGQRAVDADITLSIFGGVVQLTVAGVAGTGVVPAIGTFVSDMVEPFNHGNFEGRVQPGKQGSQRRTHHPATDEEHIDLLYSHQDFAFNSENQNLQVPV